MGKIQPSHGPVTDNTYPTTGGNRTLINGDELMIDDAETDTMACVYAELGEGEDHTRGEYSGKTRF